jgi:pimeloyl-ACP methyl ester carboxylesterase
MSADFEPVTGRYLRFAFKGSRYRLYVEEAGQGIPLLCLHTAGSDSRQYRALMNDAEITRRYRVIAFDLPWHGKSSPPAGWQDTEYKLTRDFYIEIIVAVADALALDRPVVMGCSIGGRVVLGLAADHADRFRAIIGLQSSAAPSAYYDIAWLNHPGVDHTEAAVGAVSGLMAPMSPDIERWETLWHYMQGGPGIFHGDLHFYTVDGDLQDRLGRIDTARCPLYLLTGEYDYSCKPEYTLEIGKVVPGARITIMKGLGHFPMSENPPLFRSFIVPVLDEIAQPG